jgi:sugar diacid utilization regulator
MQKANTDPLASMRKQVKEMILESYSTVEQFCWDKKLNKATVSNFLRSKKDFQISTLRKIANALGKRLTIRLD